MHTSQANEFDIISRYFGGHVGHFIDIGCSSGVALSNTFELGLLNWHGLLIEASPSHFQNLLSNYVNRGGFEFLNAALWTERKMMKFHYNQWFYSSLIEKDEANLYQAHYWVPTVVAADLIAIQPHADFISIDIEGADIDVFPSLVAAYPHCSLYCVEHAKDEALKIRWKAMFHSYNLKIVGETIENYIVAK